MYYYDTKHLLLDVNESEDYWSKMPPPDVNPVNRKYIYFILIQHVYKCWILGFLIIMYSSTCDLVVGVKSTTLTSSSAAAQHPGEVMSSSLSSSVALWMLGHHC